MKNFIDSQITTWNIIINNSLENKNYLREAYLYWEKNSQDKDTWTWSIIFLNWKILSKWTNKLPNWIKITDDKLERPKKYLYLDHAERNAIYNAAKKWIKLEWTTMYMPRVPCSPCAVWIINSWIKTLVMHYLKVIKTPSDWLSDVKLAVDIIIEAGIELIIVDEEIWWCENKFRWEIWYP